ncbi:MAG: formylglycine-generating enzyme family protein [Saprospiraceae bacterium]|nr:formylglycine-generating enzyme family protein [Saprospiraceae bacterium]
MVLLLLSVQMNKIAWCVIFLCRCPAALWCQPDMVFVRGASFWMGDSTGDPDEKPMRRVDVRDFYMATTETTVAQFRAFTAATGYRTDAEQGDGSFVWDSTGWVKREGVCWRHTEFGGLRLAADDRCPVVHVSWNDAARYCNWLSMREKLEKVYDFQADTVVCNPLANGYRLPSEAEWEYAAAGGKDNPKSRFSGSSAIPEIAWYSGNAAKKIHPVGGKKANTFGLFDLTGNVWEWCHNLYEKDGALRALRGGSWNNNARHCRITNRTNRFPDFRDGNLGFRVVRN